MSGIFGSLGISKADYTVRGRLLHEEEFSVRQPITDRKVALFAKGRFCNKFLGEARSDKDGNFAIDYSIREYPWSSDHDLIFKVMERHLPSSKCLSCFRSDEWEVTRHEIKVERGQAGTEVEISANLWEYEPDIPRLRDSAAPEDLTGRQQLSLKLAKAGIAVKELWYKLQKKLSAPEDDEDAIALIERVFGAYVPDLEIDSETVVRMITEGVYPANFQRGRSDNEWKVVINWDDYDLDPPPAPQLPNAVLYLNKTESGLEIKKVQIQMLKGLDWDCACPKDPEFTRLLRLFNCAALVRGELVSHFVCGHLVAEQAGIPARRHLGESPIGRLLYPHVRDVTAINNRGEAPLLGVKGLFDEGGLHVEGAMRLAADSLAGLDYTTYKPAAPLNDNDRFGKAKNLYWEALDEGVARYLEENWEPIRGEWWRIFRMSEDLVRHSLPYKPWGNVGADQYEATWVHPSELDDPRVPGRVTFDGELRAIRPITLGHEEPRSGDRERLQQYLVYTIFMATFWHSKVHFSQGEWGTNLQFASVAPNNDGHGKYIGTSVDNAHTQLVTAHFLLDNKGTFLMDNPYGDVQQALIDAFESRREAFAELGHPVEGILQSVSV
jgi:hypothetical protein